MSDKNQLYKSGGQTFEAFSETKIHRGPGPLPGDHSFLPGGTEKVDTWKQDVDHRLRILEDTAARLESKINRTMLKLDCADPSEIIIIGKKETL